MEEVMMGWRETERQIESVRDRRRENGGVGLHKRGR